MKFSFLALICALTLPTVVGCSKEPTEEERREAEFEAMPPNNDDLKDFGSDKISFAKDKTKPAQTDGKSGK